MHYCPRNLTLTTAWIDDGLSHCFIDTVSPTVLFIFIALFGGIQWRVYCIYSTNIDDRLLHKRKLFYIQVILHIFLPLLALTNIILQASVLYDKTIYGYMIVKCCLTVVMWLLALCVLLLERQKVLPSMPTRGHGLVLLVFWSLAFITENLYFLNLKSKQWWFSLDSPSSRVDLAIFVLHYISSMVIFVLGLKAPGIPTAQDYFIYRQFYIQDDPVPLLEENRDNESVQRRSPCASFWKKCARLGPFLWPKKSIRLQLQVCICFMILLLGRVVNIYIPIYNKHIVNSLTGPSKDLIFRWDYILIFVGLWFLQGQGNNSFLSNFRSFLWIRIQQYTVKEVQVELYQHLHSLSLRWHLSRKMGEILRVMDRGTSSVTNILSYLVFNIFPTVMDVIIAVVYFALAFNIWFGLIVLVTMTLYLVATIAITEWRTKFRRGMNRLSNDMEAKCVDSLLNFETVKYYSADDYETENYKNAIEKYQVAEWESTASLTFLNVIQNSVITLGVMSGALYCAHLVVTGSHLTVGDYVLFSTYILQLYTPLNYFGTYYRMLQTAFIDMENMFDLFNEKPEVIDEPNAKPLKIGDGQIEFKNVCFSYLPERQILKNVSFTVAPGTTTALVGQTGSGKSTIIRLLFRFYDVQSGNILIDGQNIAKVAQDSLHKYIGVVPQDTVLFNDTIRYNIRYGCVTATDEEVEMAAKASDMHDQILTFPDGYDTIVGERGLKLSGGEKQRVAIARTILKSPSIVLLDEATSSLDTKTEKIIQKSLEKVCYNRTTIIVAHRLSTIVHAEQILVLQEGEIIETGSHEELLQQGNVYASMWQQQLQSHCEETNVAADVKDASS